MGIKLLVLRRTTTKLLVDGIVNAVGVLECVGEMGERAAEAACEVIDAARKASTSNVPPAVLVIGDGERRRSLTAIGGSPETAVPVVAWESGFGHTDDYTWSGLRRIGYAKRLPGGMLALFAAPEAASPMALAKAIAAGYADSGGRLLPGRRPRITEARAERHTFWTHASSSLGLVEDVGEEINIKLDSEAEEKILAAVLSQDDRDSINSGALIGLSMQEASDTISGMVAGYRAVRHSVSVLGGGILQLYDGRGVIEMHPEPAGDGTLGLMVNGPLGSGGPLTADSAFLRVADTLMGAAADGDPVAVTASGTIAIEIGERGILVTGLEDGTVAVACGGRLPDSFHDAAKRQMEVDPKDVAVDLKGWGQERMEIPAAKVGVFLADFGAYLRNCALIPVTADVPGFSQFLEAEGVKYDGR